jgi:hypothetical protein
MESKLSFRLIAVVVAALGFTCSAQVLPLGKVSDPASRFLQQQNIAQLQQLATDASALHFAYPFYFSQALDVDEARQKQLPKGSIHFDNFNGQIVLAITGNYYASYSGAVMNSNQRARKTYEDVVLPLLKIAVNRIDRNVPIDGYAFEIAHHVRKPVLQVNTEGPENLTIMFPRGVAERLVRGSDVESRQAALLESEVYLNGEPLTLWLSDDDAPANVKDRYLARHQKASDARNALAQNTPAQNPAEPAEPGTLVSSRLLPESELLNKIRERRNAPADLSPLQMEKLQTAYEANIQKLTQDLKTQAHFVDYAPPAFIAFHNGAYLQLSMKTELEQAAGASQYRIAALAFDTHISHILRATSKYFPDSPKFAGIDFSTTAIQPGTSTNESVEFVVPFAALTCYEKYDCTGQELINRSIVLINGERVTLDLEKAEAGLAPAIDKIPAARVGGAGSYSTAAASLTKSLKPLPESASSLSSGAGVHSSPCCRSNSQMRS